MKKKKSDDSYSMNFDLRLIIFTDNSIVPKSLFETDSPSPVLYSLNKHPYPYVTESMGKIFRAGFNKTWG